MKAMITVVLLAGCWANSEDFPTGTGGDPRYATHGALGTVGPVENRVTGHVCVLVDPLVFDGCAATGAGGLLVTLGDQSAVTASDGTFVMPAPSSTQGLAFSVFGPGIVASGMTFGREPTLPVLSTATYQQMQAAIGFTGSPGNGGVLAAVTREGQPMAGVTVTATPVGRGAFYAGTSAMLWNGSSTGPSGISWLPGQPVGATSLTFTDLTDNSEQLVDGVQVLDGGLTFVNVAFGQ